MPFATDRDLLILEPNLFRDVAWAGQRRVDVIDGATSGASLTSATAGFQTADVRAGHVVVVDAIPLEVIERMSDTELTVSLGRDDADDAFLAAPTLSNASVMVTTFGPQIACVHEQLLRALGIEITDSNASPGADAITNPRALARLESLGALHLTFAAASALATNQDLLWAKAEMYRDRFIAQRNRLAVGIDLDGDGLPETTRRLNTMQLTRA